MLVVRQWLPWFAALTGVTVVMFTVRDSLDKAHIALPYLLVVLGASSRGGRAVGFILAGTAFLAFNFFFVPPYYRLTVGDPLDWLVLIVFLVTAAIAAQLLSRAQRETLAAERRAAEIDRLAALGAETLNVGRADEALAAIADVIRTTLDAARCEIYLPGDDGAGVILAGASGTPPSPAPPTPYGGTSLVGWVASSGRRAIERDDGTIRIEAAPGGDGPSLELAGARTMLLPLRVRERTVGVLRIAHDSVLTLDVARRRFLAALSYYAALGAERVRLASAAEHAEALRQADTLKDALLASVSHDIRTPLTTIKALAHDIGSAGDERAAIIEEEADRLNRFVADLLDLSRISSGSLRLATEITPADDLVGAAVQRVSGALDGRELRASIAPGDPLLLGRFDFAHSLRVLGNLIENAIKYSPPGNAVDVTALRSGAHLEFIVADRGAGIPAVERDRIFEPFYRPLGRQPDTGGTGLGLSIARRFAEAQGGTVEHRPRPGGGSEFIFRLPAADLHELDEVTPAQSL